MALRCDDTEVTTRNFPTYLESMVPLVQTYLQMDVESGESGGGGSRDGEDVEDSDVSSAPRNADATDSTQRLAQLLMQAQIGVKFVAEQVSAVTSTEFISLM